MSGGVTTFVVIEPQHYSELRARLLWAADKGELASFKAREANTDEEADAPVREFTVKVKTAMFGSSPAFDTELEDGTFIRINPPQFGERVEFDVML